MRPMLLAIVLIAPPAYAGGSLAGGPLAGREAAAQAGQRPSSRVAVINMNLVLYGSKKAQQFQRQLDSALAPFKAQAKKQQEDIAAWEKALAAPDLPLAAQDQLRFKLAVAHKQLEALHENVTREASKMQGARFIADWKDLQASIKALAEAHQLDIVLCYADPRDERAIDQYSNIHRKMEAMDAGGTVPLYVAPAADASGLLVDALNAAVEGSQPPQAKTLAGTDRVAIVNIGRVFNAYQKAIRFKNDLQFTLKLYKDSASKHHEDIESAAKALKEEDFSAQTEAELKAKLKSARQALEQLAAEAQGLLGKRQEENLVTLWKDVRAAIKTYAVQHGYDLILGYGDPTEREILDLFPNVNRKMQAMDMGAALPIYHAKQADIADAVLDVLHKKDAKKDAAKASRLPTALAAVDIGHVFNHYDRAKAFKKDLEERLIPFKEKAAAMGMEISKLATSPPMPMVGEDRARAEKRIIYLRRELESLEVEVKQMLSKKQEENLVKLWKDVNGYVKALADAYAFDVVIGYAEPAQSDRERIDNILRKMRALDNGATILILATRNCELTSETTHGLNWRSPKRSPGR